VLVTLPLAGLVAPDPSRWSRVAWSMGWASAHRLAGCDDSRVSDETEQWWSKPSAELIDRCGDAVLAAAEALQRQGLETREVVAALHALAATAEGALCLVQAAVALPNEDLRPLDLEVAGGDYLRQAELLMERLRAAYDALDIGPPQR